MTTAIPIFKNDLLNRQLKLPRLQICKDLLYQIYRADGTYLQRSQIWLVTFVGSQGAETPQRKPPSGSPPVKKCAKQVQEAPSPLPQ